jgi:catechol 2,3-dioxygenase-like lactoylglutathione lyase family enzyme
MKPVCGPCPANSSAATCPVNIDAMVSGIESVTVGVRDLDVALADFSDRLGLRVLHDSCVSVGLLAAWRRPVHESVRLIELGVPNLAFGRIRLAQFEADLDERPPQEAVVVGPRSLGMPVATIAILTDDVAASTRFYAEGLGWRAVEKLPREASALFPSDSVEVIGFSAPDTKGVDALIGRLASIPVRRPPAPAMPGRVGINLSTCRCADLDVVERRLADIGIEPVTRPTHVGLPLGEPGRVMLVRGPADELFELVEPA